MSKTVVTEEFDSEGNLVKRITTTETGDTYTPFYPSQGPWWQQPTYPYVTNSNKTYVTG